MISHADRFGATWWGRLWINGLEKLGDDYENRLLLHRRVEYDIARAQARFKKAKLPACNASRLKKGQ